MANLKVTRLLATCLATALVLSACGGSAPGASTPPTTTPTPTPTPSAAALDLVVASVTIPSASTGTAANVAVTVTAKDGQNRTIEGVPVTLAADSGSLTQTDSKTKTDGTVTAFLSKGSSRANRTITITASAGSVSATQTVDVVGTILNAQTSKAVIPINSASETISYTLQDSAGNPISGQIVTVTFSLNGQTLTSSPTNSSGVTTINIPASGVSANSIATATAAGASKTLTLSYSTTTTPTPIPSEPLDFTVQANPAIVNVNAAGSFANSSQIQATVIGSGGALVTNAIVAFRRADANSASSTFENSNEIPSSTGVAINRIRPGTQGSGQNEIVVCISVKSSAGVAITPTVTYPNPNPCGSATEKPVFLTFSGSPLFVSISGGSTIEDINNLNYRKRFSVAVTDNAGRAVENATVSSVVRPRYYGKGNFIGPVPGGRATSFPAGISPYIPDSQGSLWCPNEDLNNDGNLQIGEDYNVSGFLEPRQVGVLTATNGGKTDATGFVVLALEYGKRFATWVVADIEVRAQVGGSEGVATFTYYFLASKPDIDALVQGGAPGFEFSPFGTATGVDVGFGTFGGEAIALSCSNPN